METIPMDAYSWYAELIKPSWAPPAWIFGPVWTVLYAIIAVSFGTVFYQALRKRIPRVLTLPFVLNLAFNAAFTPLQFWARNNALASIDIVLVLTTLLVALVAAWHFTPRLRWIVFANVPYALWVGFATCLQLTITVLNWK